MEDLKAETYARLKAESMAKVLKDTLEAKAKVDAQIVDMEVDKVKNDEVSKEDDIQVNVMMSKNAEVPSQNENRCNVCDSNFDTKEGLENHMKTNHICGHCAESFETQRTLIEHVGFHHDNAQIDNISDVIECSLCEEKFNDKGGYEHHMTKHKKMKCRNCDKSYSDMNSLRRHDWRSHRAVKCNICDESLKSRQELSSHRQIRHRISRKQICRYYPDCLDGDECLFSHDSSVCRSGDSCIDQSCEKQHRSAPITSCKFQENCNKADCRYKHFVPRKAFLEEVQGNNVNA